MRGLTLCATIPLILTAAIKSKALPPVDRAAILLDAFALAKVRNSLIHLVCHLTFFKFSSVQFIGYYFISSTIIFKVHVWCMWLELYCGYYFLSSIITFKVHTSAWVCGLDFIVGIIFFLRSLYSTFMYDWISGRVRGVLLHGRGRHSQRPGLHLTWLENCRTQWVKFMT